MRLLVPRGAFQRATQRCAPHVFTWEGDSPGGAVVSTTLRSQHACTPLQRPRCLSPRPSPRSSRGKERRCLTCGSIGGPGTIASNNMVVSRPSWLVMRVRVDTALGQPLWLIGHSDQVCLVCLMQNSASATISNPGESKQQREASLGQAAGIAPRVSGTRFAEVVRGRAVGMLLSVPVHEVGLDRTVGMASSL